jgi:hypothetical protein
MKRATDMRCGQIIAGLVHDFWARYGDELTRKDSEIDADSINRGLFNSTARISDKVGVHRQYVEQLSQFLLTSLERDYPQVRPSACQAELEQALEDEYARLSRRVPGWLHASNLLQDDIRIGFEQGIIKYCDKAKKDVENACVLWNVRWIERRRRWYRDPKWLVGIGVPVVIAVLGWFAPRWVQDRGGRDEKPPDAPVVEQRAFVSQKSIDLTPVRDPATNRVTHWNVTVIWTNQGNVPAVRTLTYAHVISFPGPMPADYGFEHDPSTPAVEMVETVIGPKSDRASLVLPVPIGTIEDVIAGRQKLYVWGWAEYDDFVPSTARYRTEFCLEVIIAGDANDPTGISAHSVYQKTHNGAT